ncbi:MAG: hypothetical protein U9Q20_08360 [Campylobacterota bacterium]|nr:hypothetical protein [Campylobacterota bacterium]
MQVHSNLNAMMQLEKKLEQSANALAKLNTNTDDSSTKQQKNVKQQYPQQEDPKKDTNLTKEIVSQIEIPLSYGVNGDVISVQNSLHETLLDIKA